MKTYRDLNVWQKSMEVVKEIYKATESFPRQESYGLSNQMRRAAISIPSNIAEGFRRYHNKEYRQFLYIALGSCAELETQLTIGKDLKYIAETLEKKLLDDLEYICRMTTNLIKKL
ncbi:MAG: four helix bundle protein [Candidatus Aureabacteria bacterium]|nr:four helix bundle protein [Candidatus Auribacterota bacterium]MCK5655418.1 four helix bundle protein [Candidatus Auribacterota bacterium]